MGEEAERAAHVEGGIARRHRQAVDQGKLVLGWADSLGEGQQVLHDVDAQVGAELEILAERVGGAPRPAGDVG